MFVKTYTDSRGIILITAIGLIIVMSLVGSIAGLMATTNTRIGGNDVIAKRSFYAAEAGTEEARGRLRVTAGTSRILDNAPASTTWTTFIGEATKAQELAGYEPDNAEHTLVASLQSGMDYAVAIRHKLQGGNVLYWGDPDGDGVITMNTVGGQNVYVITGYGIEGPATREIEIEAYSMPAPTLHGAVYVEQQTTVQGSSTYVLGEDPSNPGYEPCGEAAIPGITTPLAETTESGDTVIQLGTPTVAGDPDVQYESTDINVPELINTYKGLHSAKNYTVESAVVSGTDSPGPGDGWGTPTLGPTLQDPSTCDVYNVIHYDTQNTFVKFSGGVAGCGMLLVEGDLIVTGGFNWYGVIMATGVIVYQGGGSKQITGGVLTEQSADMDVSIGGNTNVVYCSAAIKAAHDNLPLVTRTWKEKLD
jgi:hypothetical protein